MRSVSTRKVTLLLCFLFIILSALLYFTADRISRHYPHPKSENYFISLHENSTVGCTSLKDEALDYLILGDSHSYAAFDFLKLSQLSGTTKIGSCTLGGLYFETVIKLLHEKMPLIKKSDVLIYGLSYRQFTNGDNKEKQLEEHRKIISSISTQIDFKENINSYFEDILLHDQQRRTRADYETKKIYWSPIIQSLDQTKVDNLFKNTQNISSESWLKYLSIAALTPEFESQAEEFCNLIKANNIKLITVDIPESKHLKQIYSPTQKNEYVRVKSRLKACSYKFLDSDSFSELSNNRFFVNRALSQADFAKGTYDLDHMNLIGAQHFTELVYRSIPQPKESVPDAL